MTPTSCFAQGRHGRRRASTAARAALLAALMAASAAQPCSLQQLLNLPLEQLLRLEIRRGD